MFDAGVHDMDAETYHADPCPEPSLSSTMAKIVHNQTPLHAWHAHPRLNPKFEPDTDDKFDIGSAGHALMLGDPRKFVIVEAADWRTKEAKAARDAARAEHKTPLLADQWVRVKAMVAAGRLQLAGHQDAKNAFTKGQPEKTLIWREGDIWLRARLDWLPGDGVFFDDYKTAECADPDAFQRQIISLGYDMQCAFYLRGIRALKLSDRPQFRFVVQERDEPYGLSVVAATPSMLDLADRKVDRAITLWGQCLRTNTWPCYPTRTCYVELPAWHEAQVLEREHRETPSAKMLRAAYERQAP